MLKIVQERIEQAYEGGQLQARIDINQVIALGDELGISEGAAVAMFCRLGDEGYFVATGLNKPFNHGFDRYPFMWANVDRLTTKGLLEIGELPDVRERLIRGLDAAIRAVEREEIPEPEKKKRIDWLEEGKIMVRTLAVEGVKAIYRGDIPPM